MAAAAWVVAALLFGAMLWRSDVEIASEVTGVAANATAIAVFVLCLLGATISYAVGAVLRQMAKRQAAD